MTYPEHRKIHVADRFGRAFGDGDRSWMIDAACRDHHNPDLWFPDTADKATTRRALAICGSCPVIDDCVHYADQLDSRYGIWGGQRQGQRQHQRRSQPQSQPQQETSRA